MCSLVFCHTCEFWRLKKGNFHCSANRHSDSLLVAPLRERYSRGKWKTRGTEQAVHRSRYSICGRHADV